MKKFIANSFQKIKSDPDQYLLALLAFLLPFERIPSIHVHGVTIRASLFVGLVIIARAVWLVVRGQRRIALNWTVRFLLLFLLWLCLIIPAAINLKRAVEVTGFTFFVAALAVSIATVFQKRHLSLIVKALLAGAFVTSVFGLFQYFGDLYGLPPAVTGLAERYRWLQFGFARPQSTALEPLYYASYLLLPIAVTVSVLLFGKAKRPKVLYGLLLLYSITLFLTVSRGGLFAYIGLLLITSAGYLVFKAQRTGLFWRVIAVMIAAYAGSFLIISVFNKPVELTNVKNTGSSSYVNQIENVNENSDSRGVSRAQAIALIKRSPVFGVGPGQFGPVESGNQIQYFGWPIVNNEPLEILAETGIVGFVILLSFFGSLLWSAINYLRAKKWTAEGVVIAATVGYLFAEAIQYQTFSTLYIIQIWFAIGLMMALLGYVKTSKT